MARYACELDGELVSDAQDLQELLEGCGIPRPYWNDITAAIAIGEPGEMEFWFTEDGDWYSDFAVYYPVDYYIAV